MSGSLLIGGILIAILALFIYRYTKAKSAPVRTLGTICSYGIIASLLLFYPVSTVS